MTTEQFQEKQSQMPNKELILLAREEVSKLCKTGGICTQEKSNN